MAGNIQEFDVGNLGLRPSEVGVEARAGTARRIGMFSNQQASAEEMLARSTEHLAGETQQLGRETQQLGSEKGAAMNAAGRAISGGIEAAGNAAVSYLDNKQISEGSKSYAKLLQDTTNDWNNRIKNSDPNDPHVATDFMSALDERLSTFKDDGFYTEGAQKWAESHVEALRQHFAEKTMGDMSTLAGQAAKDNARQTINTLSATVHGDPTSVDFALAVLKSSTDGIVKSNPNLTGAQAGAVRSELMQTGAESIVKAAAIGYIDKTGQMPPWATDPKYSPYINGPELQMFEKQARAQQKANALTDKQTQLANRQVADLNVHQGANKLLTDNVSINPQTGQPIINPKFFKDALELARQNPDAPSAASTARTLLDWGESQQNKEAKPVTDPAIASTMDSRMFAPENPTSKMDILKAEAAGKLSRTDADIRTKIIDQRDKMPSDPQFKLAMDGAKQLIEGRTAGEKSLQSGKYAAFMQQFLQTYQQQKTAGTLPPNALSLSDPNSLLSKSMEAYKSPLASAISGNGGVSASPSFSERFSASAPSGVAPSGIQAPATASKYNPGDIVNTSEGPRRFKGGSFRDKKNWEPVS